MRNQRYVTLFISAIISFFLIGCGDAAPSFSLLPDTERFVQDKEGVSNKVDILFVVNDEPSMSAFQDELVASFSTFMDVFQTKGFDFKISVVTTSGYMADPTLSGYDPVNEGLADFNDFDGSVYSGFPVLFPDSPNLLSNFSINAHPDKNTAGQDGRSFSSLRQALQSTRPVNAGFLRADSFLAVVIVDNQDDFSGNDRCTGCNTSGRYNAPTLDPVDDYVSFLNNLTGTGGSSKRYNVSAMTQIGSPCQGGSNMVRVMELVDKTNGVLGDICQSDFGASMLNISDHIATLSTQFYLDRLAIENSIIVHVDGVLILEDANNGWTYNADANSVIFHGSAIPETGAVIQVDFDPVAYGS